MMASRELGVVKLIHTSTSEVYGTVYVYEPAVLKYIESDTYLDLPTLVLRLVEKGEKVVGYPCNDYWLDIGCQEDYVRAQEEFEQMKDIFLPGNTD